MLYKADVVVVFPDMTLLSSGGMSNLDLRSPVPKIAIAAGVSAALAYKAYCYYLRERVYIPKFTILADLPTLGTKRKDGKSSGRVVICGGR